jgi:hypothetical protein
VFELMAVVDDLGRGSVFELKKTSSWARPAGRTLEDDRFDDMTPRSLWKGSIT